MKTFAEFINEINVSKELQEELKATSPEELDKFMKKHDCDADVQEFISFLKAHCEGEIEDADAAAAAGGAWGPPGFYMAEPITPQAPV